MKCPTPAIDIRQGRMPPSRRKRSSANSQLNGDQLYFAIGFRMDGVTVYSNLTANSAFGVLKVYRNPVFYMFEEDKHIKVFRTYWPFNDQRVAVLVRKPFARRSISLL